MLLPKQALLEALSVLEESTFEDGDFFTKTVEKTEKKLITGISVMSQVILIATQKLCPSKLLIQATVLLKVMQKFSALLTPVLQSLQIPAYCLLYYPTPG